MNKKVVLFALCIGVVAAMSFSTKNTFQDPWKAPEWADTLDNPFQLRWGQKTIDPAKLVKTQELYNSYCSTCHGATGSGDGSLGAGLPIKPADFHSIRVKEQSDGAIFWKLSEGRGAMPSYKGTLTDEQRWQLVAYIRQLSGLANVLPGALKFENTGISQVLIKPGLKSQYFPIPTKVRNLINSEVQSFMLDTVVSGLQRPWSMVFVPDGTMLITERGGKLQRTRNGKLMAQPVGGNIPGELRDIKLHPKFKENGLVYIAYYTEPDGPGQGNTNLMRGKLVGDKLENIQQLYSVGPIKGSPFYFGSKIAFDGKGYLFFTVGIAGARKNAQDLTVPTGKTMRFNDDGTIPKDNPFVNVPGALPEIWSYGHRMHQGLLYDPKLDRLLNMEFGEMGGDELNVVKRGANYGWPLVTFSKEYTGAVISPDSLREGIEAPLHHWTFAPSDVEFVSGENYPKWDGNLFVGGLIKRTLMRVDIKGDVVSHDEKLLEYLGRIRDVKMGPDKLLYVMTEDSGVIVRLIPVQKK